MIISKALNDQKDILLYHAILVDERAAEGVQLSRDVTGTSAATPGSGEGHLDTRHLYGLVIY